MTELKPCPHCGSDVLLMHVNRLGKSYICCSDNLCGAYVAIDCSGCGDTPTGMLIDSLIERWNRRSG